MFASGERRHASHSKKIIRVNKIMSEEFRFRAIGKVKSPFVEKFGVPRQSGMLSLATGILKLQPGGDFRRAVEDLESFSHLWVLFVFHKDLEKAWSPDVMTPRENIEKRMGVLSTRSPHRPNPIGMSVLKIEKIDLEVKSGVEIHVSGLDLLDETPILDIKPYVPYADSIPEAKAGWAVAPTEKVFVTYSEESLEILEAKILKRHPDFQKLLTQIVELDPRPTTYRKEAPIHSEKAIGKRFAFRLLDFDIHCELKVGSIEVARIIDLKSSH